MIFLDNFLQQWDNGKQQFLDSQGNMSGAPDGIQSGFQLQFSVSEHFFFLCHLVSGHSDLIGTGGTVFGGFSKRQKFTVADRTDNLRISFKRQLLHAASSTTPSVTLKIPFAGSLIITTCILPPALFSGLSSLSPSPESLWANSTAFIRAK